MNPVTYLALGDSITEGIGADRSEHSFVSRYFDHLRCSDQCTLRNWGISGLTSRELLDLLETPALQKLLPRVSHITITTGGCDLIECYEEGLPFLGLIRTMRRINKQVSRVLSLIRKQNPEADVELLGFYIPLPAYEEGFSLASRVLRWLNDSYGEICSPHRVHLIDPFDAFLHKKEYFADEVHPNSNGHHALARLFIDHRKRRSLLETGH